MSEKLIVLIDADDTILDFQACEEKAIVEVAKDLGVNDIEAFTKDYHRINQGVWQEFEKGLITTEQINYMRFDRMFDLYKIEGRDSVLVGNYYKEQLSKQAILIDGAREFLESAKEKFRLVMVTNGITYTQTRRFKKADLNKYFEHIFVSEKIGVRKPQKEFFDYVESKVSGYNKERVVLIGDSLTSDIAGGKNGGIKTIWYNPHLKVNETNIKPTYEVKNYIEMMNLLDELSKE